MRSLHTIARQIQSDWVNPYFGAIPYLSAMLSLDSITDNYGHDNKSPSPDRWKLRSATFQGIADAMAEQWGA